MSELREGLQAALASSSPLLGLWASIPSPLSAEALAGAGAHYVVVDEQHGAVGPQTMTSMLQAIEIGGSLPLVRVARNEPATIGFALDRGALGVIVPLVETAEEAARAVAACRYAPGGVRSFGPVRGQSGEPVCLVMIETRRGLEHVEEIVAVDGLDGVYIGPSDLALSLGLTVTLRLEHPPVLDAISTIRDACAARGIACGLHCLVAEDVAERRDAGFAMLTAGGDMAFMAGGAAAALALARRSPGESPR